MCGMGEGSRKGLTPVADVTTFDDGTPVAADNGTDQVGLSRIATLREVSEIKSK